MHANRWVVGEMVMEEVIKVEVMEVVIMEAKEIMIVIGVFYCFY